MDGDGNAYADAINVDADGDAGEDVDSQEGSEIDWQRPRAGSGADVGGRTSREREAKRSQNS